MRRLEGSTAPDFLEKGRLEPETKTQMEGAGIRQDEDAFEHPPKSSQTFGRLESDFGFQKTNAKEALRQLLDHKDFSVAQLVRRSDLHELAADIGSALQQAPLSESTQKLAKEAMQRISDANEKRLQNPGALLEAARTSDAATIKDLLEQGTDPNVPSKIGKFTPLHFAAFFNDMEGIRALLDAKAEINLQNSDGNTPLHLAARNGHASAVEQLLKSNGIRTDIKNAEGLTALEAAERRATLLREKNNPVVNLLRNR